MDRAGFSAAFPSGFHYILVFKCLCFQITLSSDDLEPLPFLRFREEGLARQRRCFHFYFFIQLGNSVSDVSTKMMRFQV